MPTRRSQFTCVYSKPVIYFSIFFSNIIVIVIITPCTCRQIRPVILISYLRYLRSVAVSRSPEVLGHPPLCADSNHFIGVAIIAHLPFRPVAVSIGLIINLAISIVNTRGEKRVAIIRASGEKKDDNRRCKACSIKKTMIHDCLFSGFSILSTCSSLT